MKPEINKWYKIKYLKSSSKRGFHGKAKCIKYEKSEKAWHFRKADEPDVMNYFNYMLFREEEIKEECSSEPTYAELLDKVKELETQLEGD